MAMKTAHRAVAVGLCAQDALSGPGAAVLWISSSLIVATMSFPPFDGHLP